MVNKIGVIAILLIVLAVGYGIGINVDNITHTANVVSTTVDNVSNAVEEETE